MKRHRPLITDEPAEAGTPVSWLRLIATLTLYVLAWLVVVGLIVMLAP